MASYFTKNKLRRAIFATAFLFFTVATATAQPDKIPPIEKLLELSLEELMNIKVVSASKFEQKINDAPATMLVITAKQIQERGYEQLDDILRDIPGVDMVHLFGQAPSFIKFRGMYGDENRRLIFMIDGIIENNLLGTLNFAGPSYSLHHLERVEIIWGPASALYGANAFSAVINFITKKGAAINGFHFQKGVGSFNTSIENLMFGLKKGPVDFAISGSLLNTDGPRFTNRHPNYNNSYISNAYSFNGTIIYTGKKTKSTLGVRLFQTPSGVGELSDSPTNLFGLPAMGNLNTGTSGVLQTDFNGEKATLTESFARTLFFINEFKPNSKFTLFTKVQYRETGLTDRSYVYTQNPGTNFLNKTKVATFNNRVKAEVSSIYAFTEKQSLSIGLQYSQDNLGKGFLGIIPSTRIDTIEKIQVRNIYSTFKPREFVIQNNFGTYFQYSQQAAFFGKSTLTIGGRYDYNDVYGTTINPRIGIVNHPHEKLTFKLLFGSAYRAPSNFEIYPVGTTRILNSGLKPEKIKTYEANIIYALSNKILLQANLFHNNITNVIVLKELLAGGGVFQNQNIGSAIIDGVELKLDFRPSNAIELFSNITFQEAYRHDGANEYATPNLAKLKGNIGATVHAAGFLNINFITNWVGKRSVAPTNPLGKVAGYCVSNLVVTTNKLFNDRVAVSMNVRNLFNKTYYDPGIRSASGSYYSTVIDQPGRNGLLKITVSIL